MNPSASHLYTSTAGDGVDLRASVIDLKRDTF